MYGDIIFSIAVCFSIKRLIPKGECYNLEGIKKNCKQHEQLRECDGAKDIQTERKHKAPM